MSTGRVDLKLGLEGDLCSGLRRVTDLPDERTELFCSNRYETATDHQPVEDYRFVVKVNI